MNFSLYVLATSPKGIQCATPSSTSEPFWLPREHVTWSEPPEPGAKVSVTLPRWLAQKHRQLVVLRGQYAIPLNPPPPGLDPERATQNGSFPMSDRPEDAGKGFLARNERREKPSHPEFTGKLSIHGTEYRLAAWVREKDGKKFFSLAANEIEQRPAERQEQKRPASGPVFDDSTIPF